MAYFSLFKKEDTDPKTREPENRREKAVSFVYQRTYTSGALIVAVVVAFFFGMVPLGVFSLLPTALSEGFLLFLVANIFAFLPARWYHIRFNDVPRDRIYRANADEREFIKTFEYYRGRFPVEYDIEGKPITWDSGIGRKTYYVEEIDRENKKVKCPELGEYSDLEKAQIVERIRETRLRNQKYARIGIKVPSIIRDAVEKAQYKAVMSTKEAEYGATLVDDGIITDIINKHIPELDWDKKEDDDGENDVIESLRDLDANLNVDFGDNYEEKN